MKKLEKKLTFDSGIYADALEVINTLVAANFQAYFVGGCVRDALLDLPCKDIDITTDAKPEEIAKLFRRTVATGEAFGVMTVIIGDRHFEVATFRAESDYQDGRHPSVVNYANAQADALRRDFTINALFYDPCKEIILDFANGLEHLSQGLLCTMGVAKERFSEDYLRMLRAVRFASRFNFKVDFAITLAIKECAHLIKNISAERIFHELTQMLINKNAHKAMQMLRECNLLEYVLPELIDQEGCPQPEKYHPEGDAWQHTLLCLSQMKNPSISLAWSVLLHDVGKPETLCFSDLGVPRMPAHAFVGSKIAKKIMTRMRASNKLTSEVVQAVYNHMTFANVQQMRKSTLIRFITMQNFEMELELHRIDSLSSSKNLDNYYFIVNEIACYNSNPSKFLPKQIITGNDLKMLGLKPGPIFSKIITDIYNLQLEGSFTSKEQAIDLIKEKYGNEFK